MTIQKDAMTGESSRDMAAVVQDLAKDDTTNVQLFFAGDRAGQQPCVDEELTFDRQGLSSWHMWRLDDYGAMGANSETCPQQKSPRLDSSPPDGFLSPCQWDLPRSLCHCL